MGDSVYTLGIDIGSTASKCVILKDGKDIVGKAVVEVGAGTTGPKRAIEAVMKDANLTEDDINYTLATGYGRNSMERANFQMSELSCHAKGAYFLFPNVHTVIDIGGQDAKVLKIGTNGILENFVMNDKCAAGTGRFLDVMSRVLEVEVDDLGKLHFESTKKINISSTCTVFAESEVVSQLAQSTDKRDIINGIHRAVAARAGGLAKRIGLVDDIVMTGGVAQNAGIVDSLEKELGHKVLTSPLAQYNGALGAAIFAYQKYSKNNK
ncbi:(R)-2-hydroxyglutaryl-CoA dehydratase activase HgdC [Peptoniphilus stercorisuis]|uniref:CoA-substrate-specific enzyme activase n=1 Tax=Peptoniphilus stercorisuis TaxID=1436965 RepID=A0ABS4KC52_9FIRM|nr:(R)-2-hydroxyglutaryl-CoA dehydratase activase HgdC [Peptoniphilus stercorisuis]MBP2025362.1 putative CoA-substrate-specific enzyme activase [Peptoniphilus stercorisuis]